ncbi:MAG: glycosyltransferase family 9 protein [Desulfomonile tiedjei]|nr:glycosyltransferase family 9 protein [Desulfomonile tiedjei]
MDHALGRTASKLTKAVLVVRSGALGDTILTLPLLESITAQFPDAALTFLGNRSYLELVPPHIAVRSIDSPDWLWLFNSDSSRSSAREPVFDQAYVILNRADDVVSNLKRTGTHSVRWTSSRPAPMKHVVEHLHQGLGLPMPQRKPALAHLAPGKAENLIWIHPGSGGPKKCAPLEFLSAMARTLANSIGLDLAITISEQDAFLKNLPGWSELIDHPRITLLENRPLAEICRKLGAARLFIGNDSGISHLAAGLGVPSIVLFVATDPLQWMPWAPPENLLVLDLRESLPPPEQLSARLNKFIANTTLGPTE